MKKLIYAFLIAAFCLLGCSGAPDAPDAQAESEAKAAVQAALEDYKAGRHQAFTASLTEEIPQLDWENSNKSQVVTGVLKNIDYTIESVAVESEGAKGNAVVAITSVDLAVILQSYVNEVINAQIENPNMGEEERQQWSDQLFDTMVTDPDVVKRTERVTIDLVKEGGQWKLTPSGSLVNALSGFQS